VEERLVPVNAIIGLVTRGGLNRAVLAEAGFLAAGLEIPCVTSDGNVVVDVVLAHPQTSHLIACEAKCGSNVEVAQALCYRALDPRTVVRSAFVTLRQRVDPSLEVIYVAMAENKDRILLSLREAGVRFPLLTIHPGKISLENIEFASEALREAFGTPLTLNAPPDRFIPFDHESSVEEIEPYVMAALVAALSQRLQMISITALTERAAPHYALYSHRIQGMLRRKVGEAVSRIAAADSGTFEFFPATGNHDGHVKFLHNPEENDPRGRTQGFQRLARLRQGRLRRPRPEVPGQGSLLDELDKADNGDESADADADEAEAEDTS
jgi:hypothetical protein